MLAVDLAHQRILFFKAEPLGVVGLGVQPEPHEKAQQHRGHAFDDVHPLPAVQAKAGDLQQHAGQGAGDQRGEGRAAEENRNRLAAFDTGQPAGEIVNHPREEAGFGHAQQEAQDVEVGFVLDKGHQRRGDAPGEHDAGQPDACADFLQKHVGRHFEQRVADEKQPGAEAVGGRTNAQVVLHMGTHKADVDAVDVVDDEHDHEEREHVALHFLDRAGQDRVGGRRSCRSAGRGHEVKLPLIIVVRGSAWVTRDV